MKDSENIGTSETENTCIIDETGDFAVVWKPPRMHCAPLRAGESGTLLDWYAAVFPPVRDLRGRKKGEGGLVHRLDFETRGLVLFAKTRRALEFLFSRQDEGAFVKEYDALCLKTGPSRSLVGFPPSPAIPDFLSSVSFPTSFLIESFFRPFGPGRKQVRPVTGENRRYRELAKDRGDFYKTGITGVSQIHPDNLPWRCESEGACGRLVNRTSFSAPLRELSLYCFNVKIRRGFRHQIRCHLSWIGYPILNDSLYGVPGVADGFLGLRSQGLVFPDPRTGEQREYRVS
jgi:23S rRNA pseudouridine1911/1915/1917 synthase